MDWDPRLYERFERERTRPAEELLARVTVPSPRRIVDLGCGSGTSTALLAARWPDAEVQGLDTSPKMLLVAQERCPGARFERRDVADFGLDTTAEPVDVLFANAVLHWVPDHATLLPRLQDRVAPGGAFAFQVPDNEDEPSHRCMREVAASPPWRGRLAGATEARTPTASLEDVCRWLTRKGFCVDVWRTTYLHVLPDTDAVVELFRSTGLRPFLEPLDEDARTAFTADYRTCLEGSLQRDAARRVLLRFPRLFACAQ